jgi:hypothetical protein
MDDIDEAFIYARWSARSLCKGAPALSSDGRWFAYTSNESGRDQVYVQPFPAGGGKWRVSTDGGGEAAWASDESADEIDYNPPGPVAALGETAGGESERLERLWRDI